MTDDIRETRPAVATTQADPAGREPAGTPASSAVQAWEVLARFTATSGLDAAIEKLQAAGFDHAELALPEVEPAPEHATPEAGSKAAESTADDQQNRIVHSGVGGAFAAMMAATATAATGGAAAAVAGAALGVGLAVAGAAHLVTRMLDHSQREERERRAHEGKLVLAVRTATEAKRDRAIEILREAGGDFL